MIREFFLTLVQSAALQLQFSPLQRFSKLRVPPPCCSDSIAYVRSGGRCAGQSAPVRPQLCNQLCNSRPTTAYNYDVLAHTSGQHPAHEFQDLFERFLRMDAARSFDNIFHFRPWTSVATAGARAVVRSAGLHELWRSRADRWSALDRPYAAQ